MLHFTMADYAKVQATYECKAKASDYLIVKA